MSGVRAVGDFISRTDEGVTEEWRTWKETQERKEVEEKRRIAPGYLDTGFKMLQPMKKVEPVPEPVESSSTTTGQTSGTTEEEGQINEIDKVFGKVSLN